MPNFSLEIIQHLGDNILALVGNVAKVTGDSHQPTVQHPHPPVKAFPTKALHLVGVGFCTIGVAGVPSSKCPKSRDSKAGKEEKCSVVTLTGGENRKKNACQHEVLGTPKGQGRASHPRHGFLIPTTEGYRLVIGLAVSYLLTTCLKRDFTLA